jgi:hypothetical protein
MLKTLGPEAGVLDGMPLTIVGMMPGTPSRKTLT